MENYQLIGKNSRYEYYVDKDFMIIRKSKNKTVKIGYIEDNMGLYKRLCESI